MKKTLFIIAMSCVVLCAGCRSQTNEKSPTTDVITMTVSPTRTPQEIAESSSNGSDVSKGEDIYALGKHALKAVDGAVKADVLCLKEDGKDTSENNFDETAISQKRNNGSFSLDAFLHSQNLDKEGMKSYLYEMQDITEMYFKEKDGYGKPFIGDVHYAKDGTSAASYVMVPSDTGGREYYAYIVSNSTDATLVMTNLVWITKEKMPDKSVMTTQAILDAYGISGLDFEGYEKAQESVVNPTESIVPTKKAEHKEPTATEKPTTTPTSTAKEQTSKDSSVSDKDHSKKTVTATPKTFDASKALSESATKIPTNAVTTTPSAAVSKEPAKSATKTPTPTVPEKNSDNTKTSPTTAPTANKERSRH